MYPINPFVAEKLVQLKEEEIQRQVKGAYETPVFRAKSEIWTIVILLIVLVWFLT